MTDDDLPFPLAGLRVLDFSRVLSGPYAGRMLSDLGADVVKVEPPEGDVTRLWGEVRAGASGFYAQHNSGKRNVCLDLKAPGGAELAQRLAAAADVVIENFRPGVADRLGIGWAALSVRNPGLVMLSISGWGQTGRFRDRPAYAPVIHAESGLIARQAEWDRVPESDPMLSSADLSAGLHGLAAVLAALWLRQRTGRGQYIDLAMFDAMVASDDYAHHAIDASPVARLGGYIWPAPGGPILLSADYRHTWRQLRNAFGLVDGGSPDDDLDTKIRNRRAAVVAWMASFPDRRSLEEALDKAELVHADVVSSAEAVRSPVAVERGVVAEVGDGAGGPRGVVQSPYRFSAARSGVRGPAPGRGQHNAAVLGEWLGMDTAATARLVEERVLHAEER